LFVLACGTLRLLLKYVAIPLRTLGEEAFDSTARPQKFGTFHDASIKRKRIARIGGTKNSRLDRISFDALPTITSTDNNGCLKLGNARANSSADL